MLKKNLMDNLNEKTQNFMNECHKEQQNLHFFEEGIETIEQLLEDLATQYETLEEEEKTALLPQMIKWQEKYQDYIKECRLIKEQLENKEANKTSPDTNKKIIWLLSLVTSFHELITNLVLDKESLRKDMEQLNRIYPGINKIYQELFNTEENLVNPNDIPEKCPMDMYLEAYREYLMKFLMEKEKQRGSLVEFSRKRKEEKNRIDLPIVEPIKIEEEEKTKSPIEEKRNEYEQLRDKINTLLESKEPITEELFKAYNQMINGPKNPEDIEKEELKEKSSQQEEPILTPPLNQSLGEIDSLDENKSLLNKTCTLKNYNVLAYTSPYVSLEEDSTKRAPLYPPDMPRTILKVFMDVPTQGLIEVHSNEEINYYLEMGGKVRSVYTSDAYFYQVNDLQINLTEEIKR